MLGAILDYVKFFRDKMTVYYKIDIEEIDLPMPRESFRLD